MTSYDSMNIQHESVTYFYTSVNNRSHTHLIQLYLYMLLSFYYVSALCMHGLMLITLHVCIINLVMNNVIQKQGRLPWVTSDLDQRVFSISKYGVKVMDTQKQRVFSRHSLHRIVNITYFEDTYGKHMLAIRVAGKSEQELHVYEAENEVCMVSVITIFSLCM